MAVVVLVLVPGRGCGGICAVFQSEGEKGEIKSGNPKQEKQGIEGKKVDRTRTRQNESSQAVKQISPLKQMESHRKQQKTSTMLS